MKIFQKFGFGLAFILAFAVLAIGQTEKTQSVTHNIIAQVSSEMFYNEKSGIKELVRAENALKAEFSESGMRPAYFLSEIEKLEKEIFCLQSQDKEVTEKVAKLRKLKDEHKTISEKIEQGYQKRGEQIVKPIIEKIREKLKEFAKLKGYKAIVDKSFSLFIEVQTNDVTSEFIRFCNEAFDKEK
jgi:Skp family chaperone for outer membrane proteins